MEGKPIYYRGYQDVINQYKSFEEIMGCSSLQSFIISYLNTIFYTKINLSQYHQLGGEIGYHITKKNNLSGDYAIFLKTPAFIAEIGKKYLTIPPLVAIEIDIQIETSTYSEDSYLLTKTQKLLDWGVPKVIWILSGPQKVVVATKDASWQIMDWNNNVELLDGLTINVGAYLKEQKIKI